MNNLFDAYHVWLGIPPEEQPPNYYRLLAVRPLESNTDVIAAAADGRMAHIRTYQLSKRAELSQRLLCEMSTARLCLLNPEKKTAYDELLRNRLEAEQLAAENRRNGESLDSGLAGLFQRIGSETSPMQSRVAAMKQRAKLIKMAGSVVGGVLLILMLFARSSRSNTEAVLLFDTPGGRHQGITVKVDGQPVPIPRTGPLEYRCRPGNVHIVATRPGFKPLDQTVTVDGGCKTTFQLVWSKLTKPSLPAPGLLAKKSNGRVAGGRVAGGKAEGDAPAATATPAVPGHRFAMPRPPVAALHIAKPQAAPVRKLAELLFAEDTQSIESTSQSSPSEKHNRLPVPSEAEQQKVTGQLNEVCNLAGADTPRKKLKLAREFFDLGWKSQESPAEQFVLLQSAVELAGGGDDAALMLEVIDAVGERFETDVLSTKEKSLAKFARRASGSARIGQFVRSSRGVIDRAVTEERYDVALNLSTLASRICQRPQGKQFRKETYDRLARVQKLCSRQRQIQQAVAAVQSNPNCGEANLSLGRLLCFVQGDWDEGLPYLAKGIDAELRRLAERELNSPPTEPNDQIELADAWWALSQTRLGDEKNALKLRAGHWYDRAQSKLSAGIARFKVEKRLREITKATRPSETPPQNMWADVL